MSKSATEYLRDELESRKAELSEIANTADKENRGLNETEVARANTLKSEVVELKARIKSFEDNEALRQAMKEIGGEPTVGTEKSDRAAKSIGEAFVTSQNYKALMERGLSGRWASGPVEFGRKDLTDDGISVVAESAQGTTATPFIPVDVQPGIQGPIFQAPTIAALLGSGTTSGTSVAYLKETVTQPASGMRTDEGEEKPASYLEFDSASAQVIKLATFLPVSDEMLEDVPAIQSYINGRLRTFVELSEENALLNGDGAMDGLLANAGSADAADVDGDNLFDAILAGIVSCRVDGGLEPDAVVMSPTTSAILKAKRAVGGDGAYFSGGPYAPGATGPWGLREVVTTAMVDGSALVGAFRTGATIFRRGGLSIEASNSHADYFRKNLTAIRAEERLALAIYRPKAFVVATVGS